MGEDNKVAPEDADSKKYGEPAKYDPTFKGPIANRSCTDIICCVIFIVFIAGMFAVGYFAWSNGNPYKLIYATDGRGQICGYDTLVADKPYLFYFDITACASAASLLELQCPTTQICVSKCPTENWVGYLEEVKYQDPTTTLSVEWTKFICDYDIDAENSGKSPLTLFEDDECASYYLESSDLYGRCIPSFIVTAVEAASGLITDSSNHTLVDANNQTISLDDLEAAQIALAYYINARAIADKVFDDITETWTFLIGGAVIGMLISFIFIVLMRWIAGIVVWLIIILLFLLLALGIYLCYTEYAELASVDTSSIEFEFTTNLTSYLDMKETWLAFTIILGVVLAILILIVIFLFKRIRLAIALIKEGSRAVSSCMFTLLWPVIPFLLEVALFAFWIVLAVYLATSGSATYAIANAPTDYPIANGTSCDVTLFDGNNTGAQCIFVEYSGDPNLFRMQIYILFGLFWIMNFIVALDQIVLAGAFASYYWAFTKPKDIPVFPVSYSLGRSLRYHLGSLAFGSFIIAVIQIIRVMLEYLDHKLKGSENKVAKFLLKCMKCCFWCLEKFMKFLNKNAYIMIAVYGKNFCTSAKNAFFLLMRNIVRVVVLDKITDFLLFLGKLMVTAAVGTLAYFFFTNQISWYETYLSDYLGSVPTLNYYWIPMIIICILTYLIASIFFSVYNMAIDTLFLCFLEDLERHDGSAEKPYYMSKELMNIAGAKNDKNVKKK
ncbi:choline transporter-like protein 2 [Saccoglossus kowalevskii]|uniref:Choline transporter-like protein n=1 Tax=Saccoglossus kowalevskii TaxID=10224 RepID=A0ABM0MTT9_SACKO|nr:PREDICTED: choline transporter-like protein 2-like [Saccoglossus kowalevskii]